MSNCGRPRPLRSMNDDHSNPHLATLYRRWLSARYRGSTAAADSPRIGRTSIAQRSRFCALPQSGSCSENFVILTDVFGQTLRPQWPLRYPLVERELRKAGRQHLREAVIYEAPKIGSQLSEIGK